MIHYLFNFSCSASKSGLFTSFCIIIIVEVLFFMIQTVQLFTQFNSTDSVSTMLASAAYDIALTGVTLTRLCPLQHACWTSIT